MSIFLFSVFDLDLIWLFFVVGFWVFDVFTVRFFWVYLLFVQSSFLSFTCLLLTVRAMKTTVYTA